MAIFSRRLSNVLKIMLMSISSIFSLLLTLTALAGCSRHLMMYTSCYGNSREIRIACWKKLQRNSCLSGLRIEAKIYCVMHLFGALLGTFDYVVQLKVHESLGKGGPFVTDCVLSLQRSGEVRKSSPISM